MQTQKTEWGLNDKISFELKAETLKTDKLGFKHYRYEQMYEGIKIEGATWFVHEKNGIAKTANGNLVKDLNLSTTPTLSEEQALQYALNSVNAEVWAWENEMYEMMTKEDNENATFYPKGELVIVSPDLATGNASAESYRLAYKFDIFAAESLSRDFIYVDAQNGNIVFTENQILNANYAATGNAAYSCTNPVDITVNKDDGANYYRLRDNSRGNGVVTWDAGYDNNLAYVDIASTDLFFDEDSVAVAAHYNTEKMYDYLLEKHNRNSIDGNGFRLRSWVHYGMNFSNALWTGGWMIYGDGDGAYYLPFTSIDVTGHEITHGLTEHTAGLIYSYEPGALNEGFSDIFGTLLEYYTDPECADWLIGEDVISAFGVHAFRNMSNPKDPQILVPQPDTYFGQYWHVGSSDHGGVHSNSGLLNYWFYLMVEGGSGTNDHLLDYDVAALDNNFELSMEKAADIAYRTLSIYLFPAAQYADARAASIQAAIDLHGENSEEVATVTNAWCAVGVGECAINSNTITVLNPNGGEIWEQGLDQTISWESEGEIDSVMIELSINNGATWQTIAEATENDGSFSYTVADAATTQAIVRITDANDATIYDVSDATFTILGCTVCSLFSSDSNEICQNNTLTFTNNSIDALTYEWYINDVLQDTTFEFSYSFSEVGENTVTLVTTQGENCTDTYSRTITVFPLPNADFSYTDNGLGVTFFATSSDENFYEWTKDGNNIGNEAILNHVFQAEGTYEICLNANNDCGTTTVCDSIEISLASCNSTVEAAFSFPNILFCGSSEITFTNNSTDAATYEWKVNGETVATTTDLTHNFSTGNEYIVTLIARDANACEAFFSDTLNILRHADELDLGEDISLCDVGTAILDAELENMLFYIWDFEGANAGTTQSIFAEVAGLYSVAVLDQCGNASFDEIYVNLGNDCVWPGDCNYDGVVNNQDLLAIGFAYGETGPERRNASISWEPQACEDWEGNQENGVNNKHIDTDGNGIIDVRDTLAIKVNYALTHDLPNNTFNNDNSLIAITPTLVSGSTFSADANNNIAFIDLVLDEADGENVTAYGLAFRISYLIPNNAATINNLSVNFIDSWLGNENELLTVWKHFPENNTIEVALTRFDRQNKIGQGSIGQVILEMDLGNSNTVNLDFDISHSTLVMSNRNIIPVNQAAETFSFTQEESNVCLTPTNLQETDITCSDVTLSWEGLPNADVYRLRGRKVGRAFKVFPDMTNNFRTFTDGLKPNTTYEWHVRMKCGDTWTDYAPLQSFTTPTCKNSTYDETKDPFLVNENEGFLSEINLYPNPAKNNLNINFMSFSEKNTSVKVIDILGKTILVEQIEVLQGENNFDLNVEDLQSGTYFVQINEAVQKFMVY